MSKFSVDVFGFRFVGIFDMPEDIDLNEFREKKEKIGLIKAMIKPMPRMPLIKGAVWAIQSKISGATNLKER